MYGWIEKTEVSGTGRPWRWGYPVLHYIASQVTERPELLFLMPSLTQPMAHVLLHISYSAASDVLSAWSAGGHRMSPRSWGGSSHSSP